MRTPRAAAVAGVLLVGLLVACGDTGGGGGDPGARTDRIDNAQLGDAEAGREAIVEYGCASCHAIPGVAGADTRVGPDLENFAEQRYIAGRLPNRAEELIAWIQDPQSIEPGTAMPNMGVTEQDARDIAAFLYAP